MIPHAAFVPIAAPALARRSSFTPPSVVVTHNVHAPTRPVVTVCYLLPHFISLGRHRLLGSSGRSVFER